MARRGLKLALAASAAALLVPAASQAATKTVVAGPLKPVKGVFGGNGTGDVDAFSLSTVTIHQGDKVRWKFNGFHNVAFPKKGDKPPAFIVPSATSKYTGINDAAGAPFWFNGQTELDLNPLGVLPQGGKTEDGSQLNNNGIPIQGNPKPYTLKFTKVGTYSYLCVIHPGMTAKVKVVPKGKKIPTAKQDAKTAAKRLAAEVKSAKKQTKLKLPANTLQGGNDKGQVVQLRFFPSSLKVPVGTTVNLQVKSKPEIHTFSFGPAPYLTNVANGFVTPINNPAGPPTLQFSGQIAFPSDPPGATPPSYDGTNHGNGYWSSGILDGDPASPSPSSTKVTFTKAGTYSYICLIHPFMHGSITVG
jgi:plastocyanin